MALKDYPQWVLIHKGKGKEIRCVQGRYYLYLVHCDSINGKPKKITDKYLGRITEEGIIPPEKKKISFDVKILGITLLMLKVCANTINQITKKYPTRYNIYLSLAFLHLICNDDLYLYNQHYISILYPITDTPTKVSPVTLKVTNMLTHYYQKIDINDLLILNSLYIIKIKDEWHVSNTNETLDQIIKKHSLSLEV